MMSKEAMKARQELEQIARECGATPYVNRHYPDKLTMAFGPDAWEAFCKKLAEQPAPMIRGDIRDGLVDDEPAQQEPVAWICEGSSSDEKHAIDYWPGDIEDIPIGTKLYTSPPAQQPAAFVTYKEVTDAMNALYRGDSKQMQIAKEMENKRLYTSPPPSQSRSNVKPLTDEQFLEMILRTGTQELVGVTTFVGGSIQMHGKIGLLRSAKIIKEFVEAAHGIKGDA